MPKSFISASSDLLEMRICSFPTIAHIPKQSAPVELVKTDDSISFNYDGMKYVGTVDDKVKYRITLHSKKNKNKRIHFFSDWVTFEPECKKIKLDDCKPVDEPDGKETINQILFSKKKRQSNENPNLKIELRDQLKTMRYDYNSEENKNSKNLMTQLETYENSSMTVVNVVDCAGKVYLSQIAPKTVLDSLKGKAICLLKDSASLSELKEKLHDSVLELVVQLGEKDVKKMSMCLLLEYLLRFSKLHVKEIRSLKPLRGCPYVVTQYLLSNYTTEQCTAVGRPSQIVVTKEGKDKLFQVVLAIFTYLWSYKFPLATLQREMRCSTDRLRKNFAVFKMRLVAPATGAESGAVRKAFVATSSSEFIVEHDQ